MFCCPQKSLLNLGFGAPCEIELDYARVDGTEVKTITLKNRDGTSSTLPIFSGGDGVAGTV